MALATLRAYSGQVVCYVGEWQGDTATLGFERALSSTFECVEIIALPNWSDTCYSLMIWRRRRLEPTIKPTISVVKYDKNKRNNSEPHAVHPFRCSYCKAGGKMLFRCRITYTVLFCDQACAASGRQIHFDELATRALIYRDVSRSKLKNVVENEEVDKLEPPRTISSFDIETEDFSCVYRGEDAAGETAFTSNSNSKKNKKNKKKRKTISFEASVSVNGSESVEHASKHLKMDPLKSVRDPLIEMNAMFYRQVYAPPTHNSPSNNK